MQDFEKLGVFYLGRSYDLYAQKPLDDLILYDSKDLVTHAVCVGMTGSGKTGLCLALLEEAAIDGIPALVIDPKGDLSNLLLTFPQLRSEDFAPWVNEDDARRKGISPAEYAAQQADRWKKGLAESGQDGARIARLREAADFAVYTPGSNAGLPVSILKSFAAPGPALVEDGELLRERISTTATSLLGLMGIDADPIRSREHILISTILSTAWKQGHDLDLPAMIQQIQTPPVTRIGVLDLESFFPSKDRFTLAMSLNNLLAAPGFETWLEGEPLDIDRMLHSTGGKPRISILSISHLGDAERMFFVSLLLNQSLGWMRSQPGTTSLRAILYMDEIFGYFPPVANPPSKAPLLTLLKQGRAFGLGLVLATQNPVDLDYKGLSNTGTWFLGRLQTERDKARVLEGLEGAAATGNAKFDRNKMEQTLAGLGNRVFLMQNVHDDAPVVFQVRWALSYLRGPLTRTQIKSLMASYKSEAAAAAASTAPTTAGQAAAAGSAEIGGGGARVVGAPGAVSAVASSQVAPSTAGAGLSQRPMLPPEIPQFYLPVCEKQPAGAKVMYLPKALGCARVFFTDTKAGVDLQQDVCYLTPVTDDAVAVDWHEVTEVDITDADLEKEASGEARYGNLPAAAAKAKNVATWKKSFGDAIFRNQRLDVFFSPGLKQYSLPKESERDFRVRLLHAAREERDARAEKLKQKYAPKLAACDEKIRKAQQIVDREALQATETQTQTAISFGATILGAFLGRKKLSAGNIGKATTAMRGVGRSVKDQQDINRAKETVTAYTKQKAELAEQFDAEIDALQLKVDPLTEELITQSVKPKKTNIDVRLVALVWAPYWQSPQGELLPGWN